MHLISDNFFIAGTSFTFSRIEWGVGKTRVRCGVWVEKGRGEGHKLDLWSSIYEGLEMG